MNGKEAPRGLFRRIVSGAAGLFVLGVLGLTSFYIWREHSESAARDRWVDSLGPLQTVTVTQVYCPYRFAFPTTTWKPAGDEFMPAQTPGAKLVFDPNSIHKTIGRDPAKGYFRPFEEMCMQEHRGAVATRDGKRATLVMAFCDDRENRPAVYEYLAIVAEANAYNFLRFASADRAKLEPLGELLKAAAGSYEAVGPCTAEIVADPPKLPDRIVPPAADAAQPAAAGDVPPIR